MSAPNRARRPTQRPQNKRGDAKGGQNYRQADNAANENFFGSDNLLLAARRGHPEKAGVNDKAERDNAQKAQCDIDNAGHHFPRVADAQASLRGQVFGCLTGCAAEQGVGWDGSLGKNKINRYQYANSYEKKYY